MQSTPAADAALARGDALPPAVKGLSLVSLFNDFASEMVYPLLPAFVTVTLGGGAVALSAIDGAADLTAAALKWASGRLADRRGWLKPLILLGYATAVLVRPLIAVAGAAWQVIGFRVIDRVGKGLRTPPRDALIAEVTPVSLRGRAFGFHRGADHLGAVLGSLAAWYFLRSGASVREVISWSVMPGVVAFFVLAVVLRRPAGRPDAGAGSARDPRGGGTAPPADAPGRLFWPPIIALAGITLCRIPEALLLLRLQDAGIAVALVPLVWAALHVVRTAASYPGGWLVDRIGPRFTVSAGGLLFAGAIGAMGLEAGAFAVTTAFLVFGLVAGLTEAAERALVARLAPARTGRGFGAYHALTGLAALPAALVFGELYQRTGSATALAASAGAVIVATAAWVAVSPAGNGEGIRA
ncbi:MAG TPA: MFS transporter [Gemmatimonadales bacterium]|jgi:MFS family permease